MDHEEGGQELKRFADRLAIVNEVHQALAGPITLGELLDLMHQDGFLCPLAGGLMGELSEAVAGEMGISREEQDVFAAESQNKAEAAVKAARLKMEAAGIEAEAELERLRAARERGSLDRAPPTPPPAR